MVELGRESKLLAKHTAIYALGGMLQRLTGFLLLPVYTRHLTPTDFGIQEMVGLSTDIAATLIAASISIAVLRFYFEYDLPEERNAVLSTALLVLGGIGLAALAVLLSLSGPIADLVLDDASLAQYFWISFTSLWFGSVNGIAFDYLRAKQKSVKYIIVSLLSLLLTVALNVYLVVVARLGVLGILLSTLTSSVVTFFILTIPLLFKIGLVYSRAKAKEMLAYGLPLVPGQISRIIVNLSDRYFIKEFLSLADAGIYSLGYRFGVLPSILISQPFNQTWMPRRLEIYKSENAEYVFGRIFTYFLAAMFFAGVGISILSREALMVMADEKFWGAYAIVPIIVLANITFTLHYHFQMGLVIKKKIKYMGIIDPTNAVFVLVLNYLLIPRYGIFGAAYATLMAFVYKSALTYYLSKRIFSIHIETKRILKIILASGLIFWCSTLLHQDSLMLSFLLKLLLVSLFPVLLWGLRFFSKGELDQARAFFSKMRERLGIAR